MDSEHKCPVCGINLYEQNGVWLPSETSMPCGVDREGFKPNKDLTIEQCKRCPFETKEEQEKLREKLRELVFSGRNLYE